jgi:hypothetical protein
MNCKLYSCNRPGLFKISSYHFSTNFKRVTKIHAHNTSTLDRDSKPGGNYRIRDRSDKQQKLLKSSIVWGIMSCSPLKVNRRFGGIFRFIFSVEEQTKVVVLDPEDGGDTFFRNIPEERTLHNHRRENLTSYNRTYCLVNW